MSETEPDGVPRIRVNGEPRPLRCRTVAELLDGLGYLAGRKGVAVAVNGEVVRRAEWTGRQLEAEDSVEIVHAVAGG